MKINFHDLSSSVVYDFKTFKYKLIDQSKVDYHLNQLITPYLTPKDLTINLPTVDDLAIAQYPFVEQLNLEVVNKIIHRNHKVNLLVDHAIKTKRGEKLNFDPMEEKDKFVLNMAKQYIYDLNKFIYKYEISQLYSQLTFINNDVNHLFIGTIDVIAKGHDGWYLLILKASRTNYLKKYMGELYLQKLLFESNTGFKIKQMFVLNPRTERYIFEYVDLSQKEKRLLLQDF